MKSSRPIRRTSRPAHGSGEARGGAPAPPQQLREVFFDATRDSKSGVIYLKVVNTAGTAQRDQRPDQRRETINAKGEAVVLAANSLDDTNSIDEPNKVVPRTEKVDGLGANFAREFPPYSVTVLKLKTK